MYENGADVIFHAAGGSGIGVLRQRPRCPAATDSWAIGAETDQFETALLTGVVDPEPRRVTSSPDDA
jgi:basic membrane lipoprotein Med (substrate-binding protein (PBP1-ABC) superfamily)